jgi:Rieske 2Fe-2S family protein
MDDRLLETEFNGLTGAQPAIPASWYYDPGQFDREMREIWRRQWVYVGRAEGLSAPGAYRTCTIGGQGVIVLRDEEARLRGYFNTCRHRGSVLCTEQAGTLDRRITCPYHQWTYALDGRLLATGPMRRVANFDRADHGLHQIAVAEWGGFVFANLSGALAAPFDETYAGELNNVRSWPLADLVVGHTYRKPLACNWKIFWENYNECLHCPGIHPELCDLVPIYGRGIMEQRDDPDWRRFADDPAARRTGALREGAQTWSTDGAAQDVLPGLSEADRAAGHRFATLLPSVFMSAHLDYVRVVSMKPLGPETTELTAEWLLRPETLNRPDFDLSKVTDFATMVLDQDGHACELNQRGLKADPFDNGILMQEEYEIFLFQDWLRESLGEARLSR